ncbi:MAG: 3-methyl-2-oxobutanoate hydroxymethyltransferase [Oligoflexia bacterium]|nr:3-methyl-2-oxobutanoate hydroxymethyltransferase [Oligoflexia bacterium]
MKDASPGRITVPSILERKRSGSAQKITALTAYDYLFARLVDRAGIDLILVGDSLGTVIQGNESTIPVTLDQVIYHAKCVTRAVQHALVVGDLPFLSYQISPEQALESAGRLLKEGGVAAVKLEGGVHMAETVRRLVQIDIPVMGHVGLTPQSYHRMGGHKQQGKKSLKTERAAAGTAERIVEDALAIEDAGAFAVVLEGIPDELATEITSKLSIPTIGIGAGPDCDGQILVLHDMLGVDPEFRPRFVKRYANLGETISSACKLYGEEIRSGAFPAPSAKLVKIPRAK